MALLVLAFSGGKQSCSDSFSNSVPVYIPPKLPLEPSGCGCALTSSERKSEPLFGKLDCSLWGDFTACPVPLRSPSTFFFFFLFLKKDSFSGGVRQTWVWSFIFSLGRAWPGECFKAWESLFPQLHSNCECMAFKKKQKQKKIMSLSVYSVKGVQ